MRAAACSSAARVHSVLVTVFVPARQIAQVENDGLHGASDQFRQAVMAGKMEPDGRGEQPFLLQTLPGGADGFFLHVKGVHLAGRANQPGQENRIVPVARRGVHDCVPGETTRLIQS